MQKLKSELDAIREHIRKYGPAEISRRTKLSQRTLNYLLAGAFNPSYSTLVKLRQDMNS